MCLIKTCAFNVFPFFVGENEIQKTYLDLTAIFRYTLIISWTSHFLNSWWHHQMEAFSALLVLYAGNSPVPSEIPAQRPVTRSFDVFFDLCLNKRLSKQLWGWWFEMPSCPLWRHCNVLTCERHNYPGNSFRLFVAVIYVYILRWTRWSWIIMGPHESIFKCHSSKKKPKAIFKKLVLSYYLLGNFLCCKLVNNDAMSFESSFTNRDEQN